MNSRISSLAAFVLVAAGLFSPVAVAQSNRDLVLKFRDGFERGCNQGSTPGVTNQKGYCTRMANSFQARFSGRELTTISQSSSKLGPAGAALVNLMMSPEVKTCNAKH